MPDYLKNHPVYYAGPAKTPEGMPPAPSARPRPAHGQLCRPVPGGRRLDGDARQGQPLAAVREACKTHGGFYLGSIGGPAARLAQDCIKKVEVLEYPELGMEAVWRIEVEDFPAFHRHRRQGQRLLPACRTAAPSTTASPPCSTIPACVRSRRSFLPISTISRRSTTPTATPSATRSWRPSPPSSAPTSAGTSSWRAPAARNSR
jgi:tartrate dehydratase beta subunit/fumarate hydratase class I family protein